MSARHRAQEDDLTKATFVVAALVVIGVVSSAHSVADEAPISGTVKAIDASARTLTLQTMVQGKTRDVTIVLKPETKIVKYARPTEPGKTGFVEQSLALSDLKPGWIVSVTTKHESGNEVAQIVTIVLEKPQ
jgi:hypothetical protein